MNDQSVNDQGLSRAGEDFSTEFPGSDAEAGDCYVNLVRIGDQLAAETSRRLRSEVNMSLRALMLLATLDGLGGRATASELGQHVPITSASITSLVDTCERNGWVARVADPNDRRKSPVVMRRKGRDLLDRLLPSLHDLESRVLGVLNQDERDTLLRLLAKVQAAITAAAREPAVLAMVPRNRPRRLDYTPLD